MNNKLTVVCGFPGVGKSTLFAEAQAQGIKLLDSDSSKFDKSQFPQNYIEHITQALADGYTVLCSTHSAVRQALHEAGIPFAIVAPLAHSQKDEYIQRYVNRGSPEAFVQLMEAKWDEFYLDVWNDQNAFTKYALPSGTYLSKNALDHIACILAIQLESTNTDLGVNDGW